MNEDSNILIRYISNKKIMIIGIYINDFILVLNCLSRLDILKKMLNQKYNIKYLGEI